MTLPRSVADVLADHVVFEVECIDRLYCNVYVPQLQHAGGLLGYIQRQLGLPIDRLDRTAGQDHRRVLRGDAPVRPRSAGAVGELRQGPTQGRRHARTPRPVHRHRRGAVHRPGAGKTSLFRTERRRDAHGDSYPWIVRAAGSGGCADAQLADPDPPAPTTLRTAARNYSRALEQLSQQAGLAA